MIRLLHLHRMLRDETCASYNARTCRLLRVEPLETRLLLSNAPISETPGDNNSATTAQPLLRDELAEQQVVSGSISPAGDQDWYALEQLRAGDVIGVTVQGNDGLDTTLSLWNADEDLLIFNDNHRILAHNYYLPNESPLPNLNSENSEDSLIQYVINTDGTYFLQVNAKPGTVGNYKLTAVVARPGLESELRDTHQILFVDFDGVSVNMTKFGGSGMKTLSPLRDFLSRWDLDDSRENDVIDAILANLEENLVTDIRYDGRNNDFELEIRNSRDHDDEFGSNPYVSRVVIGGSRSEAGIPYFAIAEHVDVGNFSFDDDALVTLDRQSAPAGSPGTINGIPLDTDRDRDRDTVMIALIGEVVGRQAAHEVGHYFGNYHTDRDNTVTNVMDQGGLSQLLGDDGVFGTGDDLDIDFGVDTYALANAFGGTEPFDGVGINDTLNNISFGLTKGRAHALYTSTAPEPLDTLLLTREHAVPYLQQALKQWETIGGPARSLGTIDLRVTDLPGNQVGRAYDHTVLLDTHAAGWGWATDPQTSSPRIDLLSVMMHEVGHLLGHGHESEHAFMAATMTPQRSALPDTAVAQVLYAIPDTSLPGTSLESSLPATSGTVTGYGWNREAIAEGAQWFDMAVPDASLVTPLDLALQAWARDKVTRHGHQDVAELDLLAVDQVELLEQ